MWKLLNKKHAKKNYTHFVFVDEQKQIAIADHSMRDLADPSSGDDGLLIWDKKPMRLIKSSHDNEFRVCLNFEKGNYSDIDLKNALIIAKALDTPVEKIVTNLFDDALTDLKTALTVAKFMNLPIEGLVPGLFADVKFPSLKIKKS